MRFTVIAVLCACVCVVTADLHAKSKLLGRFAGKIKHHKRGVFYSAPPYKYGHDIPHVTHSIVKPVVVSYPPTASVTAVKVPLQHPLIQRYPVQVGHKVPVPHPHYGLRFPHQHTKFIPKPDQHFHHHHHHVAPRPVLPILPAHAVPAVPAVPSIPTFTPIPQPSVTVAHPVPAPPPVTPILPASPQFILPQSHVHLKPVLPAPFPIQEAPLYHYAPQFSYALRPGNAVQTSYFATYPRYPLVNYHQPVVPLAPSVAPAPSPVFLERPHLQPHLHAFPQHAHGVLEQPTPAVAVEPNFLHATQAAIPQPTVHLQPAQPVQPAAHVDHNGWAPVPHGHDLSPEHHFNQHELVPTQETHFAPHDHFTQQQAQQVYEHHTGEEQYHEYQHQLQHHIQQQIEQAQYEQNLNHHQLGQEYEQHNVDYHHQNQDFEQHAHDFSQQAHDFSQQAHEQAQQEYAQQEYAHQSHHQQQQDFNQQPGQEYGQPQQEYGAPQQHVLEGRSEEGEEPQRFHNHIPLGLQLPLDRPLDHFR